ncbi:hypothetical protein ABZ738_28125 [Micromonospora sp. NPDC047793]|uniref:hypothetical protein n=1 Tax=unclassified Micromonospora TaxID=2617518 RepID=UPI0010338A7B|nr:hypothetical protein [Verrucosispora sp. SN26_14.1]TBL45454.1 hypothetical protein EYA84_00310 [Verrucosispora sp. SN26_14.1]
MTVDALGGRITVDWSTEGVVVPAGLIAACVTGVVTVAGAERLVEPGENLADQIVAVIIGSKRTRFAPRPDAEGRALIRSRVAAAVAEGAPVPLVTMWGAIKHYVLDEDQEIDLAEVFAALRLAQVVRDIEAVYPPGARLDVVIEDFGVWYEDAYGFSADVQASVHDGSHRYAQALTDLLRTVAGPAVRTHVFFDLVRTDYRMSIAQAERNRELLLAYWNADGAEESEAYLALRAAGWNGEIISETRAHYLRRLATLYPTEGTAQHVERIVRYLSMVLLYQQVGLLRAVSPAGIRLAFYAPAPGPAKERAVGRVHLRALPKDLCSAAVPPWTSKGCLVLDEDGSMRPRVESFRELSEAGYTYHRGFLRLRNGDAGVRVRMDVVRRDGGPGRPLMLKQYR